MELAWMSKYRNILSTLYRAANAYSQSCTKERLGHNVKFSAYEVQIIEYILEYHDQHKNMQWYANQLGLSKSCFSKYVKRLTSNGLLEKYHTTQNKKNIILAVSELGKKEYQEYAEYAEKTWFHELFSIFDAMTPGELEQFEKVIRLWGEWHMPMIEAKEEEMIRIG